MAKKDKFAQMQQSGGVGSFQESLVQAATTVAAIERQQASSSSTPSAGEGSAAPAQQSARPEPRQGSMRYTHLPNPLISMREYKLASDYCSQFDNMTRQDWMELAIIEKLHRDGLLPDDEFTARHTEITSRPPRGLRKNTKAQMNK